MQNVWRQYILLSCAYWIKLDKGLRHSANNHLKSRLTEITKGSAKFRRSSSLIHPRFYLQLTLKWPECSKLTIPRERAADRYVRLKTTRVRVMTALTRDFLHSDRLFSTCQCGVSLSLSLSTGSQTTVTLDRAIDRAWKYPRARILNRNRLYATEKERTDGHSRSWIRPEGKVRRGERGNPAGTRDDRSLTLETTHWHC